MLDVTSPYTGETIQSIATHNAQDLEQKLNVAYGLFRDRSAWLSVDERANILQRAAKTLHARHEEFAQLIAQEGAKPLKDAIVEALRAAEGLTMCADHIRADTGRVIPLGTSPLTQGHVARTFPEPIGVVAAVSAFNHPLNLIVHQVGPAVAAGCPVIIKPSADTPLCCIKLVELLQAEGLPEGWCDTLIAETREVSESLVTDSRIGFFSFIGSAAVGWSLRSKLAPGVRCALEHGGAAPAILAADADLGVAIPAITKGGFYHAGQVCVSVQRVFVPRALRPRFVEQLVAAVSELGVGDPLDPATDVGPLIRPREVDRVEEWVNEAVQDGAEVACGGSRVSERVYAPTVLVNPPVNTKVSSMEIFGPVVCVYDYDEEREALDQANSLEVAFQAAVFTQDIDTALRLAKGLDGSAIMLNDHSAFRDDVMPFAGLRHSGLGVGGIPYTIEDMQIEKMLVTKSTELI